MLISIGNVYRIREDERPEPISKINTGFRYIEQWDLIVRRVKMNSKLRKMLVDDIRGPVNGNSIWTAKIEICDDLPDGKFYCYDDLPSDDVYVCFID